MMDTEGSNPHSVEDHSSRLSETLNIERMPDVQDDSDTIFINYAAIAWHEMRRAWRGDQSVASKRRPKKTTRTTCVDLLLSKEPLDGPVPLADMVEFLVGVWEEDLFD